MRPSGTPFVVNPSRCSPARERAGACRFARPWSLFAWALCPLASFSVFHFLVFHMYGIPAEWAPRRQAKFIRGIWVASLAVTCSLVPSVALPEFFRGHFYAGKREKRTMSSEFYGSILAILLLPYVFGLVTGLICGASMPNLRVWHGLLLGFALGPVTNIVQVFGAVYGSLALEHTPMPADPVAIGSLLMFLVVPSTWGLCFLVNRARAV